LIKMRSRADNHRAGLWGKVSGLPTKPGGNRGSLNTQKGRKRDRKKRGRKGVGRKIMPNTKGQLWKVGECRTTKTRKKIFMGKSVRKNFEEARNCLLRGGGKKKAPGERGNPYPSKWIMHPE